MGTSSSIPGPSKIQLILWGANDLLEFLINRSQKLTKKYGDIIQLAPKQILITGPKEFKHILKTNPQNYTKRNFTYDRIKRVFGDGLIVSEGSVWENHRKILQTAFTRDCLEEYSKTMIKTTERFLEKWQNKDTINIVHEMTLLTLTIAFQVFSNHEPNQEELDIIYQAIQRGTHHISSAPFIYPFLPTLGNITFFWSVFRMNKALQNIIDNRKESKKQQNSSFGDFLDLLLSSNFSKTEILDEYKTILLTGHETTACGLIWCFHLLELYPEYKTKLENELEDVLGDRRPTFNDCNSLPITKSIFLESLRLFPAIWCLSRKSIHPDSIGEYEIPAGSQLILNIYALHRNPNYWEKPNEFSPLRFLDETERHPYAFLPFSVGPHSCIGSHFALVEGILLLATIAQEIRLQARYSKSDIKPSPYLSLKPPKEMLMRVIARKR